MLLSVIIPVYNEKENLLKRLSFLCEQANKFPIEIIVSNSPETSDDSFRVCQNFDKVNYFLADKKGRAAQMNFGANTAKGEVLLFLHADVKLPEDFYDQIKTAFEAKFKAGFFCFKFDKETFLLNINSGMTKKDGLFAGGGDQCQFFARETFTALGGFNEMFCIMEDFEIIGRVRKRKIPFTIIQSPVIVSARKYEAHSWFKVNLINGYVFLKYKLGASPENLRKTYKSLLREPA